MTSRSPRPRVTGPASVVVAVLALLAALAAPARDPSYLAVARGASRWDEVHPVIELVVEHGLLALVLAAAGLGIWLWRRDRHAFWRLVPGLVGVLCAYLTSELVKLAVRQERPCRVLDVDTVVACPDLGDWSWPSNHAVVAAGLATACALALPRTALLLAPVAALIAASRVAGGVHYVHDVLAGLALGVTVVLLVTLTLRPAVARLPHARRGEPVAHTST